jgi:hypothetical protein
MRKKRDPESQERRNARLEKHAHDRTGQILAEDSALDAAVRRNIALHGA